MAGSYSPYGTQYATYNLRGGNLNVQSFASSGGTYGESTLNIDGGTLGGAWTGTVLMDYIGIGRGSGRTGSYTLTTGHTFQIKDLYLGDLGTGTFTQSGGGMSGIANIYIGNQSGGVGTYNYSSGNLGIIVGSNTGMVVGNNGTGTLNINGAFPTISNDGAYPTIAKSRFRVGLGSTGIGYVNVNSGGTLTFSTSYSDTDSGQSYLNIDGGTVSGNYALSFNNFGIGYNSGKTGSYTTSSGQTISATNVYVGNLGSGTLNIATAYTKPTNFYVGYGNGGSGTVNINTGGTFTMNSNLVDTWAGTSTINLDNTTGGLAGTWTQLTVDNFNVGNAAAKTGSFTLADTKALTTTNQYVGKYGTGTLTQTGGTNTVTNLTLGSQSGSSGTYNLQGGLLKADTINFGSGTYAFNFTGGTLSVGTFNGNLVQTGGILAPGNSPGKTTVIGDYTLGPAATFNAEFKAPGITPGVDFDWLDVTGTAYLDGTVALSFLDGFVPSAGMHFDFITAGTLVNNATFTGLPEGWNVTQFGNSLRLGEESSAVPEPATVISFLLGGAGLAAKRFIKRKK
jgi:hypothetical protein